MFQQSGKPIGRCRSALLDASRHQLTAVLPSAPAELLLPPPGLGIDPLKAHLLGEEGTVCVSILVGGDFAITLVLQPGLDFGPRRWRLKLGGGLAGRPFAIREAAPVGADRP
jgi:hypothetical protein